MFGSGATTGNQAAGGSDTSRDENSRDNSSVNTPKF